MFVQDLSAEVSRTEEERAALHREVDNMELQCGDRFQPPAVHPEPGIVLSNPRGGLKETGRWIQQEHETQYGE